MTIDLKLLKYVRDLKNLDFNLKERREVISNNSKSQLERKIAKLYLTRGAGSLVSSGVFGGGTYLATSYFYEKAIVGGPMSSLAVGGVMFFGIIGGGLFLTSAGFSICEFYKSAKYFVKSFKK